MYRFVADAIGKSPHRENGLCLAVRQVFPLLVQLHFLRKYTQRVSIVVTSSAKEPAVSAFRAAEIARLIIYQPRSQLQSRKRTLLESLPRVAYGVTC